MSVITHHIQEKDPIDYLDLCYTPFSNESIEICDECDSECINGQLHYCSSCSRQLCPDCFLSDYETICYDCLNSDKV